MMGRRMHLPGNVADLARQLEKIWQEIPQETTRGFITLFHVVWQLASRIKTKILIWSDRRSLVIMITNTCPAFVALRVRVLIPSKIHHVEELMHIKSIVAQCPHVSMGWKLGE
ncbi:hypothetical protein TNCV_5071841 [Trichonephila clavipes]|nr:hypothetical protein TNCV_5071841 [Trichonephila clavipes]